MNIISIYQYKNYKKIHLKNLEFVSLYLNRTMWEVNNNPKSVHLIDNSLQKVLNVVKQYDHLQIMFSG
jgi:hypothetical protein